MQDTPAYFRAITVSVVSHGQLALIVPLLKKLEQYGLDVIDKVLVTFNIPEPDILGETIWKIPVVKISNPRPRGFGANHNQAFRQYCHSSWFLVINPDVDLTRDVLSALLARALPDHGLLAPQVIEPGQTRPVPERGLLSPWEIIARRGPAHRPPARTAWVAGMFMLVRHEAYAAINGFDEKYFMYCEDFDFCARLQLAGWQIYRAPDIEIFHIAQRASHVRLQHLRWHVASLLKLWTSAVWWRFRRLLKAR